MDNENQTTEIQVVREISLPLFSSKNWIKFLGILMIVYGVILALTIFGIIIAWLPIWLGVLLNQTANKIEYAHLSGDKLALIKTQNNLSTYFTLYGVLALLGILAVAILIIVAVSTGLLLNLSELAPDYY